MPRTGRSTIYFLAFAGFAAGRLAAQPPPGFPPFPPPPHPLMIALDLDGDGTLSAEELKNAAAALLKLDKNGDGQLSPDELRPIGFGKKKGGPPKDGPPKNGPPKDGPPNDGRPKDHPASDGRQTPALPGTKEKRNLKETPENPNGAAGHPPDGAAKADALGGVQWFATLESGLAEARRSGRPILFLSAAPHCGGVSGIW